MVAEGPGVRVGGPTVGLGRRVRVGDAAGGARVARAEGTGVASCVVPWVMVAAGSEVQCSASLVSKTTLSVEEVPMAVSSSPKGLACGGTLVVWTPDLGGTCGRIEGAGGGDAPSAAARVVVAATGRGWIAGATDIVGRPSGGGTKSGARWR